MINNDYNIEAFKFIRKEIQLRISIHYKLLIYKLTFCGALFSFLHMNKIEQLSPFWTTSILALFFDIIIIENLAWIKNAGKYIKNNIEDLIQYKNNKLIIRWENDFAQPNDKWQCFTPLGYNFGVFSYSIIFTIGAMIFDLNKDNIYYAIITLFLLLYSQFLVFNKLGNFSIMKTD